MSETFEALKRVVDAFQEQADADREKSKLPREENRCFMEGTFVGWTFTVNELLPPGHLLVSKDVFESLKRQIAQRSELPPTARE